MIYIKAAVCIAILAWLWLGFHIITNFKKYLGANVDDPSETAGARSYGIVHVTTIWFAMLGLFVFILTL